MTEPLMTVSNQGLSITSTEIAEAISKKKLSPSLITSLESCPAQWVAGSYVLPKIIEEDDDNAKTRGSLFHKVMEIVFERDPEVRTREFITETAKKVVQNDPNFSHFAGNEEAWAWLMNAVDGYYRMGGRPQKVQIAEYHKKGDKAPKKGLEIFVKGNLGGAERDTLGFIDRLSVDRKNEKAVVIEDWKSGSKAKVWNPNTKNTDGLSEARQQIIYSMLLKQDGVEVSGARLIYPVAETVVDVDINNKELNEKILRDIKETDESLTTMIETNLFEFKPNSFCSWCPLYAICPRPMKANYEKGRIAARSQPTIDVLAKGFDFV